MKKTSIILSTVFLILILCFSVSNAKDVCSSGILVINNPSDSAQKECMGEIGSRKGKILKVYITELYTLPDVGTTGTLSKYFEEEILGMNTHGYIDIADVEVIDNSDYIVTCKILKELTNIKINGRKESQFKTGTLVKISW
jgi:hypothetical protein